MRLAVFLVFRVMWGASDMAIQSIESALGRIALTPDADASRVALFALPRVRDRVNVVFDQTVATREAIDRGDPRYIGSFSQANSGADVLNAIGRAFKR